MLSLSSVELLVAVSIGMAVALVVVLALQVLFGFRVQRLTAPMYEFAVSQSHAEAERIIGEAREKARSILAEAEASAAQMLAERRTDAESHSKAFADAIQRIEADAQRALAQGAAEAQRMQNASLAALAAEAQKRDQEIQEHIGRVTAEFEGLDRTVTQAATQLQASFDEKGTVAAKLFEQSLKDAAEQGIAHIGQRLDALVTQAEKDIEAYREKRARLLDEHMADLVGEATKVVLQKALRPDEHAELVEKALVEARASGLL